MFPSTHIVWNLLLHSPSVCHPRLPRRHFPSHQIWWQTVQLGKIKSKDKHQNNPDLWAAVCRWCCIGKPHSRRSSGATQQVLTCLQRIWPYNQHKKTKVMSHNVDNPPNVTIDGTPLDVMNTFTYLGATITTNLSLDEEITTKIGKASATMARLS